MVTLFHLGFASWASPMFEHQIFRIPEIQAVAQPGWVGVQIFFVISGFVVVAAAATASASSFLKSRMLRLYPAVWICATLTLAYLFVDGTAAGSIGKYLRSMALFPVGPWIDGQYWTLSTEIGFYSIVFFVLLFNRVDRMAWVAGGLLGASLLFNLADTLTTSYRLARLREITAIPIPQGCHFAIGIYLWLWSCNRLGRLGKLALGASMIVGTLQIYNGSARVDARTFEAAGTNFGGIVPVLVWFSAVALIALSVRFKMVFHDLPRLQRELLRKLGLMTYPLYLLHFAIGVGLMTAFVRQGMPAMIALAVVIGVLSLASFIISAHLEPSVRRFLRKLLDTLEPSRKRMSRSGV